MNILPYTYQFHLVDSLTISPTFLIIAIGIVYALAFAGPYIYGFFSYTKLEQERQEKKRTISNFRIMNEIQSELEAEVKEARIRASLKA